jgi:hypothetical protein
MPVRLPPVTDRAARILLEGIIDYAGLFPPAALPMAGAVRNYAHYRAGGTGWMLGRFVCPASSLELFSQQADPLLPRDAGAIPWRLSATASKDIVADMAAIAAFNERHRVCFEECGAFVDAYEVRVSDEQELAQVAATVPRDLVTYVEVPFAVADELLPLLARTGRRAKLRTGGVTADAFPTVDNIIAFLRCCLVHDLTAKATAGLHHAVRGLYKLTYATDSPSGSMYGYLNLFLAAARMLEESDPAALEFTEQDVTWRSPGGPVSLDRQVLQRTREQVLVSFGSCSFTEPVDEFRGLSDT